MNNDLISRSALKKALKKTEGITWDSWKTVEKIIDNAPTVYPKQGEWIANPLGAYVCNKCSWVVGKFERNFCPNCGADMRGAE